MDNFDKILSELKDMSELTSYASAQFKQITSLNKKLKVLEEENAHLLKLISSSPKAESSNLINLGMQISDEELSCITQIKFLKEIAIDQLLTMEQSRQLEIYTKILTGLRQGKKPEIEIQASQLSERELLQLVEGHKD